MLASIVTMRRARDTAASAGPVPASPYIFGRGGGSGTPAKLPRVVKLSNGKTTGPARRSKRLLKGGMKKEDDDIVSASFTKKGVVLLPGSTSDPRRIDDYHYVPHTSHHRHPHPVPQLSPPHLVGADVNQDRNDAEDGMGIMSLIRAVLEQPCSTGGRTGTVRPKHLPAGRTGLSDQFLGPVAQDQPGPVRQICPTSWLSLRSDSVRPTTGRTRLFEHRSSSRVRPVNAGSA
ncbi:hypothetical protein PCASD_11003 [Puccinia coronata f. sp. avenae]|nr:hypothetical protein PCASD_11003 [Puccinia coronata f. sp. avenae]